MYRTDAVASAIAETVENFASTSHDIGRACDYLEGACRIAHALTGIPTASLLREVVALSDDCPDAASAAQYLRECNA